MDEPAPLPSRPRRIPYDEIRVGDVHAFRRVLTESDVAAFARLTGDVNPLHTDRAFGEASRFGRNVVHGMLSGGLFSALVGMLIPGERGVYLSQTLEFRRPVFPGDLLAVVGTVRHKQDATRVVTLETQIRRGEEVLVSGEARVVCG